MRHFLRIVSRTIRASLAELRSNIIYRKIKFLYPNVELGQNIRFFGPIQLQIAKNAIVHIGDNVTFRSSTAYNFVGINRPVSICVCDCAKLTIGANCGFSGTAIYASKSITIGPYCNLGGNTSIWDTDFHPLDYQLRRVQVKGTKQAEVYLDSDVFVGANSMILKGVIIGARSIIGAGSVVTKNVPADQIWAGNPAKLLRICAADSADQHKNAGKQLATLSS